MMTRDYRYRFNCTQVTGPYVQAMKDRAVEITYETFKKHCDSLALEMDLGYVAGPGRIEGLRMKDDYAVTFHRSYYRGFRCYIVRQSSIEYVFMKEVPRV